MSPGAAGAAPAGRPTRAVVDLDAIEGNARLACRLAGPGAKVLAVVKADAYGHGAVPVARAVARAGAAALGVATAEEARELRRAGVGLEVLVLSEVPAAQAGEVVALGCDQTVYSTELADALAGAAAASGRTVAVHLKVDTGMGRVGVDPADAAGLASRIRGLRGLRLEGVMTHLAESERASSPFTALQLERFESACAAVEAAAGPVRWRHAANSALLMLGTAAGNLARPGIMLYGAEPGPGLPHRGELRPALTLVTAVAFIKRVPAGARLSYGGTFTAARPSLIATLPAGYADGYRRCLSNRGAVLVRGRRAPVAGTVCMDLTLADVTDVPGVAVGDEVVLVGGQGTERIAAEEVATLCGTIAYEVLCGVGPRVPRVHCGAAVGYDSP